jgi:hypothetical protein
MDTNGRRLGSATFLLGAAAALLATLVAGPPSTAAVPTAGPAVAASGAWPPTVAAPGASPATVAVQPAGSVCHVVAVGRAGRAWLPWVAVAVPGGRSHTVRLVDGNAARVDASGGLTVVQRTSRRAPGADRPVVLEVVVDDGVERAVRTCEVHVGRVPVDPAHGVRRVVRAD